MSADSASEFANFLRRVHATRDCIIGAELARKFQPCIARVDRDDSCARQLTQELNCVESESTDSDELRNDDGDTVVDPPEDWSEANRAGVTAREEREGESLDARLAAEEPDVLKRASGVPAEEVTGRVHNGQVSGTPEDGESLYNVVDE